jgi:acyl-CoA thioester hydrolase
VKIRVYYEDTDTGGVVYHSNYINFCERARSEAFFKKGLSPALESGHFVARKLEANYLKSAKLGDELEVTTELLEMKAASFVLLQKVYRGKDVIFKLEITLVYITLSGKPQKITDEIKELILSLF